MDGQTDGHCRGECGHSLHCAATNQPIRRVLSTTRCEFENFRKYISDGKFPEISGNLF